MSAAAAMYHAPENIILAHTLAWPALPLLLDELAFMKEISRN